MGESPKVSICRAFLLGLAFFTTGLCISIIGPTLPDLKSQTYQTTISGTITVVSANAFGSIIGLILGSACFKLINSYLTIATTLFICAIITITIPYCLTISSVTLVFLLQGISLGLILKGAVSQFYTYWKQRYQILIVFYFIFALGATCSPLITSSFVFTKIENKSLPINGTDLPISSTPITTRLLQKRDVAGTSDSKTTAMITGTPKSTEDGTVVTSSFEITSQIYNLTTGQNTPSITNVTTKPTAKMDDLIATSAKTSPVNTKLTSPVSVTTVTTMSLNQTNIWSVVFSTMNNVKTAYVIISVITLLSALSHVFICCCTSCRWLRTPPLQSSDYPFKFKLMWSSRINFCAVASSTMFSFLIGAFESTVTNLLTVYCMEAMNKSQRSGVLLTSVFWCTVALSRFTVLFFQKKSFQFVPLATVVCVSALSCSCMITFSKSWMVLWFSIAILGLTTGYLAPVGFCWLDQQLGLGPWYCAVWLCAFQFGRMTIPYLTAYAMVGDEKTIMFPIMMVILVVLLGLMITAFKRTVSEASQLTVVDKLVLTNNGEAFAYTKPVEDDDGFELDHFDEYTYFDRQKTVSYFVKQAPTPTPVLK